MQVFACLIKQNRSKFCAQYKYWKHLHLKSYQNNNTTMASTLPKPPNVLVYCPEKLFKDIAKSLYKCLHSDKYVIYELKSNQVLTTPWKENVALLLVFSQVIDEYISKEFIEYATNGGKLILLCSKFSVAGICSSTERQESFTKVTYNQIEETLWHGKYDYSIENGFVLATNSINQTVIWKVNLDKGIFIPCSVNLVSVPDNISQSIGKCSEKTDYLERSLPILKSLLTVHLSLEGYVSELPAPTSGYVIVEMETQLKETMGLLSLTEISLEKAHKIPSEISQSPEIKVPLITDHDNLKSSLFDKDSYFSSLKSNYFGKTVVFFPVVTSTMYPAEHLSDYPGVVVIANRQLTGKGRGDNKWLSPEGCAAFTLHFPLMMSSRLGQRLSVIQHMASLAVVHGLKKRAGFENLEFSLKWPNDIYYEKDKKIGGVLVTSTIQGDVVHVYVGIGVNVSNQHPTICVNNIIKEHNHTLGKTLPTLKMEEVIATTLTELENLVHEFKSHGPDNFLELYYSYWIHKNQVVTLSESNVRATVQAIDDYGFLIVETEDGKKLSLQPDGNRFDMMKNLIAVKEL